MLTEIIPLGTASAIPTRNRHLSSTALVRGRDTLLFDCGEGTQMQLIHAGLRHSRISAIFITHLHGDHFFGLLGLLSTLSLLNRENTLILIGPEGLKPFVQSLPGLSETGTLTFPVEFVELPENLEYEIVLETKEYLVEARPVEHRIFTVGYRYQEKPKPGRLNVERANELGVTDFVHYRMLKEGQPVTLENGRTVFPEEVLGETRPGVSFAYVTDTRPCKGGRDLAEQVDLLHHEATFTQDLSERASETGHSTALEAAKIAREAGASKLLISHFSARYTDVTPLIEEARTVFEHTEAAVELSRYRLDSEG